MINWGVSRRFQSTIYAIFHEESESEVQNAKILQGNIKNSMSTLHVFHIFKPDQGVIVLKSRFVSVYCLFLRSLICKYGFSTKDNVDSTPRGGLYGPFKGFEKAFNMLYTVLKRTLIEHPSGK